MKIKDMIYCPKCGALWKDEDGYGVNIVGIEDPLIYDGVSWWKCTNCNTKWDRWTEEEV